MTASSISTSTLRRIQNGCWHDTHLNTGQYGILARTGVGLPKILGTKPPASTAPSHLAMKYIFGPAEASTDSATRLIPQRCSKTLSNETDIVCCQLYAVESENALPVALDGRVCGVSWEDHEARYCMVGNVYPSDSKASRAVQTRSMFENAERVLGTQGFAFTDCVRTWLYADAILDWYDTLNEVRTGFFHERKVFEKLVPASTGIGAANSRGAALVASLLAIQPKDGGLTLHRLPSPLQCSAEDYGSSFSRAIEVRHSGHREVYISGTASIDPRGYSVHLDDIEAQIQLSLDVVEAILKRQQLGWADLCRVTAYFKDLPSHLPTFKKIAAERGITSLPLVCFQADICRDDLLFEIEADAIALR